MTESEQRMQTDSIAGCQCQWRRRDDEIWRITKQHADCPVHKGTRLKPAPQKRA